MSINHQLARAIAMGDVGKAHELNNQLTSDQHAEFTTYATAVMTLCVDHRFKTDSSPEAVRSFVDELRVNFAEAQNPIKPMAAEATIRALLGEEHLLDEVDTEDQLALLYPVIRKVVADSPQLQEQLDQLLQDADELVQEWVSQE